MFARALPLLLLFPLMIPAQAQDCKVRLAEDFVPMTRTERAAYYESQIAGPNALFETAVQGGLYQGLDRPREYGQGTEGYALRFGSLYGQRIIAESFENGLALWRDEDNRYFNSGEHGVLRRIAYAAASTLLARHDDGSRSLSVSGIGGTAIGAFVSRTWASRSTTTLGDGAVEFGISMGLRFGFHLAHEFSPRLLGRLVQ